MGFGADESWWSPGTYTPDADDTPVDMTTDYPTFAADDPATAPRIRARGLVLRARARRLWSTHWAYEPAPGDALTHVLTGLCTENTAAIRAEARRRDIPVRVLVGGSLANDNYHRAHRSQPFTSAREIQMTGYQHYWAEIRLDDAWWTVDVSAVATGTHHGSPYAAPDPPAVYDTFPDSIRPDTTFDTYDIDRIAPVAPP